MSKVNIQQNNFSAGEWSPRLRGRTDLDRYGNAVALMLNAHPVVHGGCKRRGGTRYYAAAKFANKKSRLVPFVVDRDHAYMLEVGDTYIRVHAAGGVATGVELASPYTEAMLPDIDYAQGADTMFVAHPSLPIQRVRRFDAATFDLSAAPFTVTPFDEQGHTPAATLTLSAATVGAGRTATASIASFLPTDVGRKLTSGAGTATVTGYTDTTHLTVDITIAFAGAALASGAWTLSGSPQAFIVPDTKSPVGATAVFTSAQTRSPTMQLGAKTGAGVNLAAGAAVFVPGDFGLKFFADSGIATIVAYVDPQNVTVDISTGFAQTVYPTGSYGITQSAFRSTDEGSYLRVNGGLVKITQVSSSTQVLATIIAEMTSIVASPPLAWSMESSLWSAANGYPRTITIHEQRLVPAGTTKYPQTIWGSRTGEYFDFTKGDNDADSYSFTIAADELNPISFVTSLRTLIAHTYGGEFSLRGGIEKPITPTNVRVVSESDHGSKGVRPATLGKESVFVQRAGRKLRGMGWREDLDGYSAPDLTTFAEHITLAGGITALSYQQEPDSLLWSTRGDGALLSSTFDREQQVNGWARHYTDGVVEWVATIPNGDHDETWLIVRRYINGNRVRYIEIIDEVWQPFLPGATDPDALPPQPDAPVYGYTVDCGKSFDNAAGQTVFAVPHLIGKTVDILADGAVQQQQVVPVSGNVTLSRPAYRTLIGLHFESQIVPLTPEVGTATGTAQGTAMRSAELVLRFLNSVGGKLVGADGFEQEIPAQEFGPDVLDQPPEARSIDIKVSKLGWANGSDSFAIVQDQPLPMHLLAIIRRLTTN